MIGPLQDAIGLLTLLPARPRRSTSAFAVLFFPLLGGLLGLMGAQWLQLFTPWVGSSLAALLVLGLWTWLTGARLESGLAYVAGSSSAAGVAIVVLELLLRWQALARMPAAPFAELAACLAVSRAAMAGQAWFSRPLDDARTISFLSKVSSYTAVAAVAIGAGLAFLAGTKSALAILAVAYLSTWLWNRWFDIKLGGVNMECLHATCATVETFSLLLISCRSCFW